MLLNGNGRNTPLEIPLIVVLWENPHFRGTKRVLVRDEPNLENGWTKGAICMSGAKFNDTASAVGVHPGPDYESWKVRNGGQEPTITLWSDPYFGGNLLQLQTGIYSDLHKWQFNDTASSVRFEPPGDYTFTLKAPEGPAARIDPIPIILRLHTATYQQAFGGYCGAADNVITLVESTPDLKSEYGDPFNDSAQWVEILMGPSWSPSSVVELFKNPKYKPTPPLGPFSAPFDADLVALHFKNVLTSVRIVP
jgi:hypothetical protein